MDSAPLPDRFDGLSAEDLAAELRTLGSEFRVQADLVDPLLLDRVVGFFDHESPKVRAEALALVGPQWRAVEFRNRIETLLSDSDEVVRHEAMRGIAAIARFTSDHSVAKFLLGVVRDEGVDIPLREAVLGWATPKWSPLMQAVNRSVLVFEFVIDKEGRSAWLLDVADRLDRELEPVAPAALAWVPPRAEHSEKTISTEMIMEWLDSDEQSMRFGGLITAVGENSPEIVDLVEKIAVSDPVERLRVQAIPLLGQFNDKDRAYRILKPLLASTDPSVRSAAVKGTSLLWWGSADREVIGQLFACIETAASGRGRMQALTAATGVWVGTKGVIEYDEEFGQIMSAGSELEDSPLYRALAGLSLPSS